MSPTPQSGENLLQFLRDLEKFTADIQQEISVHLLKDEKFRKRISKESEQSEEAMMAQIDKGVKVFLGIVPLAMMNGINPIMTLLASHSAITGDPLIASLVEQLNQETLDEE